MYKVPVMSPVLKVHKEDKVFKVDKVFREVDSSNRQDNRDAFQALTSQGIKVIKPDEKDLPAWEVIAKKSIEDLVRSGEISAEIVGIFQNHLIHTNHF